MKILVWTGLAVHLCIVPAIAQTTPPPPAVSPPTGGPSTPPLSEPANAIHGGTTAAPDVKSSTEAEARSILEHGGFRAVSDLRRGADGTWRGKATKDGAPVNVAVDQRGVISAN
jgi:hypothetical protein